MIARWRRSTLAGVAVHKIYCATVPASTASRQLFGSGVRAARARGPLNPSGFTRSANRFVTADPSYVSFAHASQMSVRTATNSDEGTTAVADCVSPSSPHLGGAPTEGEPTCSTESRAGVPYRDVS
jgi:hypothetical protein